VICLSLFTAVLWAPVAHPAESKKVEIETAVEAWYHTADDTVLPSPAPVPVAPEPANPYAEDTLHVAIAGGQEEARTYITLDLADLPTPFELGEAILTLPIDPNDGSLNADTSRVQVCLSDLSAKSQEGSFESPPKPDCKTSAPASYFKEPFPHLRADITDFGDDLAFSGLAILPTDRAKEKQDTWHVAFYGKKNKAKEAKPITAKLTILPAEDPFDLDGPTAPPLDGGSTGETGGGEAPSFDSGGGSIDLGFQDSASGPSLDPAEPAQNEPAPEPVEPGDDPEVAAAPELDLTTNEVEPAYTIVWALPLLLLALSLYLGPALTRDVVVRKRS
jgi:hypothetical protein